ncbi:MAG: hypothetical protein LCH56_17815 [Proteobacteria bacterium]|nr:hypothetical protein [Pseudomonadota bacterium]
MSEQCDHAFKVTVNASKFEAVVARSCKATYTVEMIAHDPTIIPHVRIFNVAFTSPEDRDRVRIAMRFLEQEQAEIAKTKSPSAVAPTLARRLASA